MFTSMLKMAGGLIGIDVKETSQKEVFYYNNIYFKRVISFYKQVQQKELHGRILLSPFSFHLLNLKFGDNFTAINNILGKPSFQMEKGNTFKVAFYHVDVNDIDALMQLQFLNNKLYFAGFHFNIQFDSNTEKENIVNAVMGNHFSYPYKKEMDYPIVKDTNNNYALVNDETNFSICFLEHSYVEEKFNILERAILLSLSTEQHHERL